MNPESLCAKCQHLILSKTCEWHYCLHRNRMNSPFNVVCVTKCLMTCINFTPKQETNMNPEIHYTVEHGYDELTDGDYEYYGVYDRQGDICAMFYVDAISNAKEEAETLAERLNGKEHK